MADIFQLFNGKMGAGGATSVPNQDGSSFSDISSENDLVARLASGSNGVNLLVDYSDFSNFVTFNSADSYVTITADQILSEYPVGGTVDDVQAFTDSLDGYQQYFLGLWPSCVGHLRLNPAVSSSYVAFNDFGVQDGVARSSFISPGTGSLTIQGWIDVPVMTGSNDVSVVFNKQRVGSTDAVAVYVSGSSLFFNVISGSTNSTVSGALGSMPQFFAAVLDRSASTGTVSLYTAFTGTYPVLSDSKSVTYGARFDLNSGSYYIGSGSIAGQVVRPFTGSLDDITVWAAGRTLNGLSGTYNRKVYAQSTLLASYRFNEATVRSPASYGTLVLDGSGHRLDGRIQQYFSASRGSGSLAFDVADPILTLDDPDVINYVVQASTTASLYDRNNQSLVFNLFPDAFTSADPASSDVFKNFALIMARHFDRVKVYINQFAGLRRVSYDDFDQAPNELLEEVGRNFGWDLQGSFVTTDSLRYFIGRDVYSGPSGNNSLNTRLADIKNQFWRRMLQNLPYIYKTKGTRESVEALLRSYGVDNGFVRLKEYARKTEGRLPTARVESEKSVYSLKINSGSSVSAPLAFAVGGGPFSVELRVRFPLGADGVLTPTQLSGVIFNLASGSVTASLWYEKPSVSSMTGNVYLTSSAGRLQMTSCSLFDDTFYNLTLAKERVTGSTSLFVVKVLDGDLITFASTSSLSGAVGYPLDTPYSGFTVGQSGSTGEFWAQEARVWNSALIQGEVLAHSAHFESYGRTSSYNNKDLLVHLRLNDGNITDGTGGLTVINSVPNGTSGAGIGFAATSVPFTKFLEDYSYIPSIDYGWNQDKIRVYDGSTIDPQDQYQDEKFISLEFNLYDQLNEDISHMMSSYDELNNVMGYPMNRYRESYEGLQQMRETYFKRLQGKLNLRVFIDMLDFFDTSFVGMVEKLLPARSVFNGDEIVVESHMLERPKYQYQIRPVRDGIIDIVGGISVTDRWGPIGR